MTYPALLAAGCLETARAVVRWAVRLVLLAALTLGALLLAAAQAPIKAPDWVAARVAAHVTERLSATGLQARLDAVLIELRDGLTPAVTLQHLVLRDAAGQPRLEIDAIDAVFSRRAALAGTAAPKALRAEGLTLKVVRDADGRLSVRAGAAAGAESDALPALSGAETPGALLDQVRAALSAPPLGRLETVGLTSMGLEIDDALRARQFRSQDGSARLTRRADGGFDLTADLGTLAPREGQGAGDGGRVSVTLTAPRDGRASARLTARGLVPASVAGVAGIGPLADLLVRIDAPVSLDLAGDLDPDGHLDAMDGRIAIGTGRIALPGLVAPMKVASAHATMALSPRANILRLSEVSLAAPRLSFTGHLALRAEGGLGGRIAVQGGLQDLRLTLPRFYAAPLTLDAIWAEARYDRNGDRVDVPSASVAVGDTRLHLSGMFSRAGADRDAIAALDIATVAVTPETLVALWPRGVIPATREWLRDRVEGGTIRDVSAALRRTGTQRPDLGLSFAFDGATVRPVPALPPIENGHGTGGIDGHTLSVAIRGGTLRPPEGETVTLSEGLVRLPDIRERNGTLQVGFRAETDTAGALSLLASPSFRGGSAGDGQAPNSVGDGQAPKPILSAGEARGRVGVVAEMAIPLYRGTRLKDVDYAVTGAVTGFETAALLPGRALSAARLSVTADPGEIVIEGPARLDGQPLDVVYTRPITPPGEPPRAATITARGPLTADLAAGFGLRLPPGMVRGAGRITADIGLPPGAVPTLALRGDLGGMRIAIPAIGVTKAAGRDGSLSVSGRLGPEGRLDRIALSLPGLEVQASAALNPGGGTGPVSMRRLAIGDWLDVQGRWVPAADGAAARLALTGGTLDLRGLPQAGGGGAGGIDEVDIALDRVRVTDRIALTGVRGALSAGMSGTLTARVNGAAPISVRLSRQSGGMALRGTAGDAGAVLRAAGLYGNLHGGALDLRLVPTGRDGVWRGQARMTDTAIRDAPVFASLLSAVSLVGAVEQAQGAGITFGDVRADFRLTRSGMVIDAASATGPSLGLSLEGAVDFGTRRLDLQGVLSPIYFLNQAGSFMTRRGEGLIGLSYTIGGTMDAPQVAANPLSMLTPGFLREIFRGETARLPGAAQ